MIENSSKYILLSHKLSKETPSYGNRDKIVIEPNSSISAGETANSSRWIFTNNHIGTHIDVPRHFSDTGKCTFDYPIEYFIFNKVSLVDLPCNEGHLIDSNDLETMNIPSDIEFLAIRTGFENYRDEDRYWNGNPGLKPSLASYLRSRFPKLRCIGFDFISITSWLHRSEGKLAHKAFLCPESGEKEILAIEDMSLLGINQEIDQIIVSPLFMNDGNGGAVTVICKYI
jgi:arylformamidase